jgi:hypothetical protein
MDVVEQPLALVAPPPVVKREAEEEDAEMAEAAPADAAAKAEQSEARRKAEAKRREEMRDAIRRDRQAARASPPVGGGDVAVAVPATAADGPRRESTAFELVLKSTEAAQPLHPAYARAPPTPATPAPPTPAPPTPSPATPEADPEVARAIEARFGGRVLSESQRQAAISSLNRRRAEVLEAVEGSTLKGEAGRALLNDSQREMNTITRMLSNMSKRYVVVRGAADDDGAADGAGDQAGSAAAEAEEEEVAVIEEEFDDEAEGGGEYQRVDYHRVDDDDDDDEVAEELATTALGWENM